LPKGKPKHKVGDKVLGMSIISSGEMFEAQVVKVRSELSQFGDPIWEYFLRYKKWKPKWNEWILESHVFKLDKEGLEMMHSTNQGVYEKRSAKAEADKKAKAAMKGNKEVRKEDNIDVAPDTVTEKAYILQIPTTLQRRLLDDLDMVEEHKLLPLPRDPNLKQILARFEESLLNSKTPDADPEGLGSFIKGLSEYFDRVMPISLAYSFERVQMKKFWMKSKVDDPTRSEIIRPSEVYGAEHLLRLFVKLPQLMQRANAPQDISRDAQTRFIQLLKWMDKEQEIFHKEIEPTDTEYLEQHQKELS